MELIEDLTIEQILEHLEEEVILQDQRQFLEIKEKTEEIKQENQEQVEEAHLQRDQIAMQNLIRSLPLG